MRRPGPTRRVPQRALRISKLRSCVRSYMASDKATIQPPHPVSPGPLWKERLMTKVALAVLTVSLMLAPCARAQDTETVADVRCLVVALDMSTSPDPQMRGLATAGRALLRRPTDRTRPSLGSGGGDRPAVSDHGPSRTDGARDAVVGRSSPVRQTPSRSWASTCAAWPRRDRRPRQRRRRSNNAVFQSEWRSAYVSQTKQPGLASVRRKPHRFARRF